VVEPESKTGYVAVSNASDTVIVWVKDTRAKDTNINTAQTLLGTITKLCPKVKDLCLYNIPSYPDSCIIPKSTQDIQNTVVLYTGPKK